MEDDQRQFHRRVERIALSLPVRIEAKESKEVSWDEISHFLTLSHCGAGFEIKHQVKIGQLLLLTAPLPQKLRCYDYSEQQYRVWAIVRYCSRKENASITFHVGVAFVGKYAPLSFHQNPAKLYDLKNFTKGGFFQLSEAQEEFIQTEKFIREEPLVRAEQKYPRYSIPTEIVLEAFDQIKGATICETTVSENISLYGAAIFTSLNSQIGDLVKVNFTSFNVSIRAKVRNRRIGSDGIPRLHLEFIDRPLPLEGIE